MLKPCIRHDLSVLARSKFSRKFYTALGILFVAIGIAGYLLPLLPGTIFMILAAASFAKGNPALEERLLAHPKVGPTLVRWRREGSITQRGKFIAILSMSICVLISLIFVESFWIRIGLMVTVLAVAIYIATRPTALAGSNDPSFS